MNKSAFIFKSILLIAIALLIFQIKPQITLALTSGDYQYEVTGSNARIAGYTGSGGDITIPSTLDGYTVTSIYSNTFMSCSSKLTSVVIPNSVTSIEWALFSNCINLTSVTIPNSVTSIGSNAFGGCIKLTSVTIPNSVTSIDSNAFARCSKLTSIDVGVGNTAYSSTNGILYNKSKTTLICYPAGKPDSLFTVPNSVASIGYGAFGDCSSLTSVTIPSSVTSIGYSVFIGCSKLTLIDVGVGNTAYSSTNGILYNKSKTKLICYPAGKPDSLFTVPSSVTSIEYGAFCSCINLKNVNIPISVTYIAGNAFSYCSSLTSMTIPNSVKNIGWSAFSGCTSLTSINIPNSLTYIDSNTFSGCSSLTNVTIPNSVTSISYGAFSNCTNLTAAKFFGNAPTMDYNVFDGCTSSFKVYYLYGKTGFTNPWYGYPTALFTPTPASVTAASASYNSIKATWGAVSGASGYEVWRAATSTGTYSLITTTTSTSFTNTGLTTGTTYYYKVRAYTTAGTTKVYSNYSAVVSAKSIPATPASVTAASASYNSIKTTWGAVSGASGYEVWRTTSSTGTYSLVTTTTSTTFTNTGLTTGTTYYYKVRGYTTVGTTKVYSNYSAVVSAKPIPAVPVSVTATSASYNSIKTTWGAVAGASGYEVWRAASSTGTYSLVTTTTSTSFTNTGLTTGTTYYYKVRAYTTVGTTKVYSNYSAVVSAKPIPATPVSVTATSASYNSIKTTWGAVAGASGYEVYRATSSTGTYSLVTTTTSTSFTNTGLTTGTTYYYKVRAYTTVGTTKVYSNYSAVVSAKPI